MFADKLCSLSDEALLTHYHSTREFKAFKLIYLRHKDRLYRYCIQISRRNCASVLEQLWSNLLERPPKLGGRQLRNWLYIQANRLLQSGTCSATGEEDRRTASADDLAKDALSTGDPSRARFLNALQKLPRVQRNVFLLHVECGLSLGLIADIERLPLKTCAAHYRQSRESLATFINGQPRRAWKSERTRKMELAAELEKSTQRKAAEPKNADSLADEVSNGNSVKGIEVPAI
ncbi:sigma factor-like helix-turn-helix DNA-binding protein [Microbulbifer aggregans]|uniref:sigma factor-like helix-turn-helix DNA-binding protein n=1 Tax=Microbulbifer aggregans TaxID=1769779 RepID=UPI001CFC993B|nr:sigma factor-like helix-turn-helix DNA-binding protein [Microbulbifer aggregans]